MNSLRIFCCTSGSEENHSFEKWSFEEWQLWPFLPDLAHALM